MIGLVWSLFGSGKLFGYAKDAQAASDPVIAAAGDIACDPASSAFNGGNGTATKCRQKSTSDLLVNDKSLTAVLNLGDAQYECGSLQAFMQSYDLSWGRVKSITYPVPGNHEYQITGGADCTSANAGAAGYFDYFGAAAGTRGKGYYSFDLGDWHVIALNSNCAEVGGCGTSSPQGQWLQADLASHTNMCTLAYWHHPLFSSGTHASSSTLPFWQLLYQYNADLILTGHDHIYERFAPQSPNGVLDTARGIRQFIIGSGGEDHHTISGVATNSEARNGDTFGILKLTLHASSYDWQFVPEAGGTFTDSGTGPCHDQTSGPTPTPLPSSTPLYASFTTGSSVGGVSFADEDILKFDGTAWSLFFDGSDVGLGSTDLFAFSIVDSDTLLMAFTTAVTVNGLSVTPQDVVKFEAASLGSNTAGTFSMYLKGVDVGLDTSNESIDALALLPDGRVLISTTGTSTVPGVSGQDEDVLAFTPTSLGDVTSGNWALYFDGSDVGLADSSNEDVDALEIDPTGAIYLSTLGDFSVPGVSGFDEDVFVCSPTSLGTNTACNYSSTLYFDGSLWGLDANDVDAFSLPSANPLPAVTPSNTPTNSPTPLPTNTPAATPTVTSTAIPTNTPTLVPSPTATNPPTQSPTATATFTPTATNTQGPTFTPTATFTVSPTPVGSDLIFADGFDSGNFSAWSSASTGGGDLSVSPSAALVGSNGMQAVINDTSAIYVTDNSPSAEPHYRMRFYFDPNTITMADGSAHYIFTGYDTLAVFQVDFRSSGGNYQIRVRQYNDSNGVQSTAWVTINDGPHAIEVEWRAATVAGANNGGVTLWIDGVQQASLSGVDNDTRRIESVQMGAVSGIDATTQGIYFLDGFESRRESYIGP